MSFRRRALTLAALPFLAAALGSATCATKVVELGEVIDGGNDPVHFPGPFCLTYVSQTGEQCTGCYDEWGVPDAMSCVPKEVCAVRPDPTTGERCLICVGSAGETQRACLRCDPPVGTACAICRWSDGVGGGCQRCLSADGTVLNDDCDVLRPELR